MGMTYGGKPVIDSAKVAEYLAKDTAFTIARDWHGIANRFTCTMGDKPGRGLILLRRKDIDDLDFDNVTEFDLKVSDQLRTQTLIDLHPLQAWCITPGHDDDPDALFAVEIVDKRYYLWQTFTNAAYNAIRAPDGTWITDTLDAEGSGATSGSPTYFTWYRIGESLWDAMNVDDAWPGWPNDPVPNEYPNSWHFWQVPSIAAFQAVARRLGCSLRYNPFTGAFDIVQLGATDTSYDTSVEAFRVRDRLWDEKWIEPWTPRVPEQVRVVFRRLLAEATGNPYEVRNINFPDTELAEFVRAGTRALVWDDLVYTGSNGTDLDTRAAERADDYARIVRYFNPNTYRHYRGVGTASDLFLGPRCSSVTWQDVGQGIQTIIESAPLEAVDYASYLHGVGEFVTEARCVGNDIQETLLTTWWGKPIRFS